MALLCIVWEARQETFMDGVYVRFSFHSRKQNLLKLFNEFKFWAVHRKPTLSPSRAAKKRLIVRWELSRVSAKSHD
jgi:hypothetical protein